MTDALSEELEILCCMYPELDISDDGEQLNGNLEFDLTPLEKISIHSDSEPAILVDTFPNNKLSFTILKNAYPHFGESLTYTIESNWMSQDDLSIITKNISESFAKTESCDENESFLLTSFLDYIKNIDFLFENNSYHCVSSSQYKKFEEMLIRNKQEVYNNEKFVCCICLDTFRGREMTLLACEKHNLCKTCFADYYTTMITQGEITNIRCPQCPFKKLEIDPFAGFKAVVETLFEPDVPLDFFDGKLSDVLCTRYRDIFKDHAFIKLEKHIPRSCISCPSCDEWCLKTDLDDNLIHCDKCSLNFCFECLHSWHGTNNACKQRLNTIHRDYLEEYIDDETPMTRKVQFEKRFGKNTIRLEADALISEKLLDKAIEDDPLTLTRCSNCRTVIERIEGCNNMKCTLCWCNFCFLCGEILKGGNPYDHFNDNTSECYQKLFYGMAGTT